MHYYYYYYYYYLRHPPIVIELQVVTQAISLVSVVVIVTLVRSRVSVGVRVNIPTSTTLAIGVPALHIRHRLSAHAVSGCDVHVVDGLLRYGLSVTVDASLSASL